MEMITLHLLILEDNPDDAELAVKELERKGFNVKWTRVDTKEAFREALAEKPDLILADYFVPSFDAMAALQMYRQLKLEIPLIVYSGAINEEMAIECMKSGATDYVFKDNLSRLGPVVKRALEEMKIYRKSKQAEEALRESEERYRVLFETAKDAIFVCDKTGKFVDVNRAACEVLGYSREELLKLSPKEIDADPIGYDAFIKLRNGLTDKLTFEINQIRKDGTHLPVEITGSSFNEKGQQMALAIARDISERKKTEEEKKKLEAQLHMAQKMEAIGKLAGGVAHDFNNILTVIMGNASLALMEVGKDNTLRQEIEEIRKAGERAASLTRQLLAFSRKQIVQPKILDINELLTDIEIMLGRLIGENVELLTIQAPALWRVEIDPGQIEQVIINLAINARDAMLQGGKLTIETDNVDLNENYFREHGIEGKKSGRYVVLAVSDTGNGMDKETQEHIFEPFFTTKEVGKGTGLGLSTIYGIVKQNNGFIWVYSEPGQGTTFKVYLPEVKKDADLEKKEQTPVDNPGGSETVLIVEDNDLLRNFAQKALRGYGYRVMDAENGEDALRVCKEHDGQIDLMITDVVMPKMGGREAAERLRPLYPQMKVIYMSGYTDNAIVHHGVLEPGLNFLEKPFTPEGLARKAREVLDAESFGAKGAG